MCVVVIHTAPYYYRAPSHVHDYKGPEWTRTVATDSTKDRSPRVQNTRGDMTSFGLGGENRPGARPGLCRRLTAGSRRAPFIGPRAQPEPLQVAARA